MELAGLPPELVLHTVSFLTRETVLDPHHRLGWPKLEIVPDFASINALSQTNSIYRRTLLAQRRVAWYTSPEPEIVPDLPSINALSQTSTSFHRTLNQTLYHLCVSVGPLGKLALLFAVEHELESTLDKLVAAGIGLDTVFLFGDRECNLLQIAAARGLRRMVVKLLGTYGEDMEAAVHARDDDRKTALEYAARDGHVEIVRLLAPIPMPRSNGALGSDPLETHEDYLSPALVASAAARNTEMSKYLLLEGANPNSFNYRVHSGATPLHYAANAGNLELVQLLLASGADPDSGLFHVANINVAEVLLAAGADPNAKDHNSANVLAHKLEDIELLRFFLERGVNLNNEDYLGNTPLHLACRVIGSEDLEALVELLLQFGATVEANSRGITPLDVVMLKRRSRHVAKVLKVARLLEPSVHDPNLKVKMAKWEADIQGPAGS